MICTLSHKTIKYIRFLKAYTVKISNMFFCLLGRENVTLNEPNEDKEMFFSCFEHVDNILFTNVGHLLTYLLQGF